MATDGADAKLSSLFGKKKKKGAKSTTVNANIIAKETARAEASAAAKKPTVPVAAAVSGNGATKAATSSPQPTSSAAPTKTLSELKLSDKDAEEKTSFQWAKQPKKYKNMGGPEGVAKTWAEQEERNRTARRINLDSERAFPTLGVDATRAQLSTMKAPTSKGVETKNVWATLNHGEDDEDSD